MTQEEKIRKVIEEITTYLPNVGNLNYAKGVECDYRRLIKKRRKLWKIN